MIDDVRHSILEQSLLIRQLHVLLAPAAVCWRLVAFVVGCDNAGHVSGARVAHLDVVGCDNAGHVFGTRVAGLDVGCDNADHVSAVTMLAMFLEQEWLTLIL